MASRNEDPVLAWGEFGTVYRDGSFDDPDGRRFSRDDMKWYIDHYRCTNRINKPMQLLFYTDCMNGRAKNWEDCIN